ncbi:MAG: ComEC/Rec2 family competence protein [Opitutaceae bacterium]|nr:ComEC/Rec2 family competence protein [Opitutaceae bacterium]
MLDRTLGQRAPLLWVVLPWIMGLVLGRLVVASPSGWWVGGCGVMALMCAVAALRLNPGGVGWLGMGFSLMLSAFVLYTVTRARLASWEALPPREVRVELEWERLFPPGDDPRKLSGLGIVRRAAPPVSELVGQRFYVSARLGRRDHRPVRSSVTEVVGRLERLPKSPSVTTFDGYLVGAGMNFKLTQARVLRVTREATAYRRWCERMQEKLGRILGFGLQAHPSLEGVFKAMVLGQQQELSEVQDTWFTHTGTLHLFSISGMHIGVIAIALRGLLAACRLHRGCIFVILGTLLWLYVDITGRAPSALRAFLMVMVIEVALVGRLPRSTVAAWVASAWLVLVFDPMQLFSASFQMSYGIVGALLLLGLPLGETWGQAWAPFRSLPAVSWTAWHRALAGSVALSCNTLALGLSTALVSALTGVLYFGLLTPGALVANLVAIPLASLAILAGLASLVSGLAGGIWLSLVFNHGAALVLWIVERLLAWFSELPGVHREAAFASPAVGFAALAGLFALLLGGFHVGWSRRYGGFWPPFVYTATVLIVLVSYPELP